MYRHYCHAITLGGYKYRRRKKDTQKRKKKRQVFRQLNKKTKNSLSLIIFYCKYNRLNEKLSQLILSTNITQIIMTTNLAHTQI
jgi:16S rRNA C1402 (ribose-2'-O) methylase RsmI